MKLLNLAAQVDYVLEAERDADGNPMDGATIWQLRCLTNSEKGALDDSVMDFSKSRVTHAADGKPLVDLGMSFSVSDRRMNRVRLGVVGWVGLLDADENPVPYAPEAFTLGSKSLKGAPMAVIEALPQTVLKELARKIADLSGMSASEGNF